MKYCVTADFLKKKKRKRAIRILAVCLILALICVFLLDLIFRETIKGYPLSVASATIQKMMDDAMSDVLSDAATPNMSEIDRVVYDENETVVSIEVDTHSLNKVKTDFVRRANERFFENGDFFIIKVPLGTLFENEFLMGRGPKIPFRLQPSANFVTAFKSDFTAAGINNTLHTVSLEVSTDIFLLTPWDKKTSRVKTNYILSQTLIAGKVPDAYTNVENAGDELTNDLFDHKADSE